MSPARKAALLDVRIFQAQARRATAQADVVWLLAMRADIFGLTETRLDFERERQELLELARHKRAQAVDARKYGGKS